MGVHNPCLPSSPSPHEKARVRRAGYLKGWGGSSRQATLFANGQEATLGKLPKSVAASKQRVAGLFFRLPPAIQQLTKLAFEFPIVLQAFQRIAEDLLALPHNSIRRGDEKARRPDPLGEAP